jgi:hypothetical protein
MLNNEGQSSAKVQLLPPASRGAGAANGAWIDARAYEGDLVCVCSTGAVTGSVAYKIQDATDGSGTGVADITGATAAGAANSDTAIIVNANNVRGWIRFVATVTTGPVLCGATLLSHPKYTT